MPGAVLDSFLFFNDWQFDCWPATYGGTGVSSAAGRCSGVSCI